MKTIIKELEDDIRDSILRGENLDARSWGQEDGILISVREAQTIVAYYKERGQPLLMEQTQQKQ